MDTKQSIEILENCIQMLEEMTDEQFHETLRVKGLIGKNYDEYKYEDEDFEIILLEENKSIMNTVLEQTANFCIEFNFTKSSEDFFGEIFESLFPNGGQGFEDAA